VVGGIIGFERQYEHKAAGVRTHMLVSLGAALFTVIATELKVADVSRVIQGVAAGIGFLGGGTILKLTDQAEVKGLTTAASIWITAALGTAVGAGMIFPAILTVLLAGFILFSLHRIERWWKQRNKLPGRVEAQPPFVQ
jgi:putative Mg2+ transporter-C (MgtC) family protein